MNVPRTARLDFKLMGEHDAPLLFELDSDPHVMQYLSGGKVTSMQTIKEVFIPRMLAYRDEQRGWGLWQVTLLDSAAFIGWVLIRPMGFFTDKPDFTDIEIGWRFKRESWGKGYASEAALAVADTIATEFQVRSLSATALKENKGSIKVMKKIGMQFVKDYVHCDEEGELPAVLYRKMLK
ncbi:GNAT family N-acetyltransferase [Pseudoalteromonas sp. H105]|uniref:GNAT family N-acetyltransferase n=1 Tax=Pseudoalteromonas sp. H105 TaxID=1348393 RepID=UPI0007320D99|nr:GNAT family N-acetyltransferase [Pseudoalteromonas sp. H105]KTF16253.1 acetyltransferase [Pseudoalteromonas sp. H105]